jgi:hypothetical protein
MLRFLDVLLTIVHLAIISFNLLGWIPLATRKAHFISILLTAASWLLLGIWFGIGYCPFTDWQWEVKSSLGEKDLPQSFIKYFADKVTGQDFSPSFVNRATAVLFFLAVLLSVYVNFMLPKRKTVRRTTVH